LKLKLLGVLAVLSVAVLAGCGGDDNKSSDTNTSAATNTTTTGGGGAAETVDVSLTDFKIDPPNPKISKAGTVEFKVKNDGGTVHNLEVEGPSGEKELDSNLNPGQTGTMTVDLSKPGKYEWYCPIDDHKKFGMRGEITVGGGGSTTTGETNTNTTETTETETQSGGNSGSGGGSGSDSGGSGSGY
jgi:uncharacterized cupredoxin-like copper-binding protein